MRRRGPAALALLLACALAVPGGDWPQWRGPSGQGHSDDPRVPLSWGEKENLAWKVALPGAGNSTPVVWGDRVFLTAATEKGRDRLVLCYRAADGGLLWKQTAATGVPQERTHAWNGYASASCATDGKHVYAFFGTPGLFCYTLDGKLAWKKTFGTFPSVWGSSASPFLFEDTVLLNCDNDGGPGAAPSSLVALDKATGTPRWSTPRNQGRGFSTPRLLRRADGSLDLLLNGPDGLWAYDPATGKERWQVRRSAAKELHKFGEPVPVDDGKYLHVLSGRRGPFQVLRIPDSGPLTREHIAHQGVRSRHRDVASAIVHKGLVYACDKDAILTCADLKSGKQHYATRLAGAQSLASPVLVRGKLLFLLDTGLAVVVEPGPTFKAAGRNRLGAGQALEFGASPAVADGRLYLRSQTHLYCLAQK